MRDFLPVLIISVLILAALFVLYGNIIITPTPKATYTIVEEEPEVSGLIGAEEELTHIIIAKDFSVSRTGQEKIAELNNITVSQGLISGVDKKVSFSLPRDIEKGIIRYNIINSNYYGNIILILNDNIIHNNYSLIGEHEIILDKNLFKQENDLEIKAESSGWKIWAPTTYILGLDVIVESEAMEKTFNFSVKKTGLTGARVILDLEESEGNLSVKVNDIKIYEKEAKRIALIDFSPNILKENNSIEFLTDGEYNIKEAEIIVFYQPEYKTQIMWYNISSTTYNELDNKNATLRFYIDRITGDVTSISIKITDGAGKIHNIIPQGILRDNWWYSVELTKNDLAAGSNKIEFKTDQGSVLIKNVTVSQ